MDSREKITAELVEQQQRSDARRAKLKHALSPCLGCIKQLLLIYGVLSLLFAVYQLFAMLQSPQCSGDYLFWVFGRSLFFLALYQIVSLLEQNDKNKNKEYYHE